MLIDKQALGRAFLAKSGFHSMAMWFVALAITAVFAVDLVMPLGIGIHFFYISILLVTLVLAPSRVLAVTAASSVFTVIGTFLSPEGELWAGLVNSAITLIILWFLAYFGMIYRQTVDTLCERERDLIQTKRAIRAQNELLEQRVRERTEQLRESEELFNFSLRTIHTGGWDLDLVDHTAHRTLEHDRIFGYGSLLPQWTYERFLEHVLPEDRAEVDRRFREATTKQTEWSFECRIRRVDGEVRWIWAAGEHQRDAAGQTRRMAGIVHDITERKLAEQALLESKRRLRLAFEDREHLLRDLHDNIIQAVYAIGMQLEACQRLPRNDPKDVAKQLAHAIRGLNGVIRDVRGYISDSGPQNLSRRQLRADLADLVKSIGATGALRFRLNVDPSAAAWLTPPQAEHILLIAREALSNALKHSQARHGTLSLHRAGNSVRLEVSDDGVGFEPKAQGGKGAGLDNMASRARQIGSKLEMLSSSGQGTRIILTFPEEKEIHAVK